jgi:hypothetical protein
MRELHSIRKSAAGGYDGILQGKGADTDAEVY